MMMIILQVKLQEVESVDDIDRYEAVLEKLDKANNL